LGILDQITECPGDGRDVLKYTGADSAVPVAGSTVRPDRRESLGVQPALT
jgi:hypothetical protein